MGVEFKPVSPEEQQRLRRALDANAKSGEPLKMDPLDTSFVLDDRQVEDELIDAIHSVPCHY